MEDYGSVVITLKVKDGIWQLGVGVVDSNIQDWKLCLSLRTGAHLCLMQNARAKSNIA